MRNVPTQNLLTLLSIYSPDCHLSQGELPLLYWSGSLGQLCAQSDTRGGNHSPFLWFVPFPFWSSQIRRDSCLHLGALALHSIQHVVEDVQWENTFADLSPPESQATPFVLPFAGKSPSEQYPSVNVTFPLYRSLLYNNMQACT